CGSRSSTTVPGCPPVSVPAAPVSGPGSSPPWSTTSVARSGGTMPRRQARGCASAPGCAPSRADRPDNDETASERMLGDGSAAGPGCSAGAAGAGLPALERTALVLGHTAPDTRVLSGLDGPLQAGVDHFAPAADLLGLLDLGD